MSAKQRIFRSTVTSFRLFFRRYPALPYLLKWLAIAAVISIGIGFASACFLISLEKVTGLREANPELIALLPAAGGAIGLLYYYFGKSVEGGNSLLLHAIHHPESPVIPLKMAPFVYLGTLTTHLFGGSAGREGTALQMAGSIADQATRLLKLNGADRQILLISAVSAGFSSVFGTPLAGAIFGIEFFLTGRLRYQALFPAFVSAVIADAVTRFWPVIHTHYAIPLIPQLAALEILYSLLAGILFGFVAAFFSKALHYTSALYRSAIRYAPLRPVAGGMIVAMLVWVTGTTKYIGLGIPVIVQSLDQSLPPYDFILKIIFTVLTLGAGFKGGEVTPLFFIGATLGNALSYIIPLPAGLLSGMGFVAVFAGATNTPLACSLMAIELFGSGCGPYAALACVVAYLVSGHNSIYSAQVIGEPKHRRFSIHSGKKFGEL